jgi:hypothetical protein
MLGYVGDRIGQTNLVRLTRLLGMLGRKIQYNLD